MDSLFGHLATRFGSAQAENLATEALHYILTRTDSARRIFVDFLRRSGAALPGDLHFETQAADAKGAIPDMVGKTPTGEETVIVEAKFWAGLTVRQPVAYLDRLPVSSGLLVFVAPALRFTSLWPELVTRCRDAGREVAPDDGGADWCVARLGDGRRLALTSWRTVLEALHVGLTQAGESSAAADVLQLRGLTDRMDAEAFLPLTSEELTANTGRRVLQLCQLVDAVKDRLIAEVLADPKSARAAGSRHALYYQYFRMHNAGCALFFNPYGWAYHGYPIWLEVHGGDWKPSPAMTEALRPLGRETPPRLFVSQSATQVPILLPVGCERDVVINRIVEQVRAVADLIRNVPVA